MAKNQKLSKAIKEWHKTRDRTKGEKGNCEECGKEYINWANRFDKRFCSEKCRRKNYNSKYYSKNKEKFIKVSNKQYKKRYGKDEEYTNKHKVRALSQYHFKKKGICSMCKSESKTELHHVKYTVEDIKEVCKECHKKIHKK